MLRESGKGSIIIVIIRTRIKMSPKKALYYMDIILVIKILYIYLRVRRSNSKSMLELINNKGVRNKRVNSAKLTKKIRNYCELTFWVLSKLSIYDTCCVRSIVIYRVLRAYGSDASVNFGIVESDKTGHCWVSLGKPDYNISGIKTLFSCP
jgi:hypothetical protein